MTNLLIILILTLLMLAIVHAFRRPLISYFSQLRGKLHVQSLRKAIISADKDKAKTGRKNIVVFNSTSGSFEPVQKRLLKFLGERNKKQSDGVRKKVRKKNGKVVKVVVRKKKQPAGEINTGRIKEAEQKSLYVTR